MVGLEPTHLSALDPKSSASANSATPAYGSFLIVMRLLPTAFPATIFIVAMSGVGPCSETLRTLEGAGCPRGVRTHDPAVNSRLLYLLSYRGINMATLYDNFMT